MPAARRQKWKTVVVVVVLYSHSHTHTRVLIVYYTNIFLLVLFYYYLSDYVFLHYFVHCVDSVKRASSGTLLRMILNEWMA